MRLWPVHCPPRPCPCLLSPLRALQNKASHDFGGEIIPMTAKDHKVSIGAFDLHGSTYLIDPRCWHRVDAVTELPDRGSCVPSSHRVWLGHAAGSGGNCLWQPPPWPMLLSQAAPCLPLLAAGHGLPVQRLLVRLVVGGWAPVLRQRLHLDSTDSTPHDCFWCRRCLRPLQGGHWYH